MSRGTTYSPIHPIFHSKFFDRIFCSPPVSLPFLHVKLYSNESGDPSLLREISICFCEAHWRCMVQDDMKKVNLHVNWMLNLCKTSHLILLFCSAMSPHDFLLAFVPSSSSWRCSNCTAQTNFSRFFSIFKFSRNLDF